MTPFRLRKRVKSLLGRGDGPQIVRYPITFVLPDGSEKTLEVEEHYSLLMASQGLSSPISTGRRAGSTCPDGGCDLCRVEVISPAGLSERTEFELGVMQDHADGKDYEGRSRAKGEQPGPNTRLACHTKIRGPGGKVKVRALVDFDMLRGDDTGT
jgi:ferredoxin